MVEGGLVFCHSELSCYYGRAEKIFEREYGGVLRMRANFIDIASPDGCGASEEAGKLSRGLLETSGFFPLSKSKRSAINIRAILYAMSLFAF